MEMSAETDQQSEQVQATNSPVAAAAATSDDKIKKHDGKRSGSKGKGRRSARKTQLTLQQVTDRFAACGRCSYFWAGYRVIFGEGALETAVLQSRSGWLNLEWNLQMPELVLKSYGVRLDVTHFHYEGCCEECRRHFIYQAAESDDEAATFRIELSPRTAK